MSGNTVPVIWFENEHGLKWFPPMDGDMPAAPDGFIYMHARNPLELRDYIYRHKTQVMCGCQTYMASLVLAMTRPTLIERWRSVTRIGRLPPTYALDEAIIRAATSCERCLNVLCYEHGINDGYARESVEWWACYTECEYCEGTPHPTRKVAAENLVAVHEEAANERGI